MNRRTVVRASAISMCALALMSLASGPANAAPTKDPGYIVVHAEDAVAVGDAVFFPTGPITEDTLVVIADADGSLPGGVTEDQIGAIAHAREAGRTAELTSAPGSLDTVTPMGVTGGTQWGAPLGGLWGAVAKTRTGYAGTTDSVRLRYTFGVTDGTNQHAVGRGYGYYRGYNGSTFGTWGAWYSIGTASSDSNGSASVPWGNVLAVAQFQGKSTNVLHVAQGQFVARLA